jgi:hypothetical protein
MKPKPIIKEDKETGIWKAYYISEFGQEFKCFGHTAGTAISLWYKKFGKKLGSGDR